MRLVLEKSQSPPPHPPTPPPPPAPRRAHAREQRKLPLHAGFFEGLRGLNNLPAAVQLFRLCWTLASGLFILDF